MEINNIYIDIERERYEFFDDALVDQDGECDAEDADESKIAAGPPEVVFQGLSSRTPFLYPLVLVCFHSSSHFSFLSSFSLLPLALPSKVYTTMAIVIVPLLDD